MNVAFFPPTFHGAYRCPSQSGSAGWILPDPSYGGGFFPVLTGFPDSGYPNDTPGRVHSLYCIWLFPQGRQRDGSFCRYWWPHPQFSGGRHRYCSNIFSDSSWYGRSFLLIFCGPVSSGSGAVFGSVLVIPGNSSGFSAIIQDSFSKRKGYLQKILLVF